MSAANSPRLPIASVHGRFQPLHRGHLEYILAGFERAEKLIIGISQPNVERLLEVDVVGAGHRSEPENNPLTFDERKTLMGVALTAAGIESSRYQIVPFPIEQPERTKLYVPTTVPVLTTTYDKWNVRKISLLRDVGFQVENLWTRQHKEFTGKDIRAMMAGGDDGWKACVPEAIVPELLRIGLPSRIRTAFENREHQRDG